MRTRQLLLGDWGPVVRDPIDLLRLTFLIGAVVVIAVGEIGAGLRLALTFALVLLCRLLDPPRPFDLGFCVAMALQAWGNVLNAFGAWDWYDKVVHLVLPFFAAPLLYLLLVRLDAVPDLAEQAPRRRRHLGIVLITFGLGVAFEACYEVYEYFAVQWLGADLEIGYGDTIGDMIASSAAALLGGVLLVVWSSLGWTTTRRAPEEVLERRRRVRRRA